MAELIVEPRKTYRAPGTSRRYLTAHAAFIAWAKHIIFSHCNCEPNVGFTCGVHRRLFERAAWVCACGGELDGPRVCLSCGCAARHETIPDNARYGLVRDRLARWLKWRAKRAAELRGAEHG